MVYLYHAIIRKKEQQPRNRDLGLGTSGLDILQPSAWRGRSPLPWAFNFVLSSFFFLYCFYCGSEGKKASLLPLPKPHVSLMLCVCATVVYPQGSSCLFFVRCRTYLFFFFSCCC